MRGMTRVSFGARAVSEPLEEQRHHVERRPADVDFAGGVGVAHRDRIVDEQQFDFERLPTWRCHTFPALKPSLAWMIGAQPAQTLRAKRTVSSSSGL